MSRSFARPEFVASGAAPKTWPEVDLPEIAVAGRSNVGKSSLLNSLLGRKALARVSKWPGRTQLINFFKVGDWLCLVDLPGFGFARVPAKMKRSWEQMIRRYFEVREGLVGVLLLLDCRREPGEEEAHLWDWWRGMGLTVVPVLTKTDKLSKRGVAISRRKVAAWLDVPTDAVVTTSARTNEGRQQLRDTLEALAWSGQEPQE